MLTKLTPTSLFRAGDSSVGKAPVCGGPVLARNPRGRAMPSTLSSESTSAERLRDFRKTRREENKRSLPGPRRLVLKFAPTSYIRVPRLCKLRRTKSAFPRQCGDDFFTHWSLAISLGIPHLPVCALRGACEHLVCSGTRACSGVVAGVIVNHSHLGVPSGRWHSRGIVWQRSRSIRGLGLSAEDFSGLPSYLPRG